MHTDIFGLMRMALRLQYDFLRVSPKRIGEIVNSMQE